jgi:hypothetical protein
MSESLGDWLRLREPADWTARSENLAHAVAEQLNLNGPLRVLDLGTGTGSNVRYLMERLPGPQRWLAVDQSPELLALLKARTFERAAAGGHEVETRQRDLNDLEAPELFEGRHLVTASALLDLVSESWLRALVSRCRDAGASALFALTYNGESTCMPAEPEDELVRDLFNRHQRTDKGLGGPATGPDAVARVERCFKEIGYEVRTVPTDWHLGVSETEMQRYLIDGWADASGELSPDRRPTIADWRGRRLAHLDTGRSRITVGHHDLAAWPAGRR